MKKQQSLRLCNYHEDSIGWDDCSDSNRGRCDHARARKILKSALCLIQEFDVEPTSALKQAASDAGIPYGKEMGKFTQWGNLQLERGFNG